MNYEIVPLVGVGDIHFGMRPAQVHNVAGMDFEPFYNRTASREFPTDHYSDLGMFCYYDAGGVLEAIEFHTPGEPSLNGVQLLPMTLKAAQDFLRSLGGRIEIDQEGGMAYDFGLAVWSSGDDDEPIQCVTVFPLGALD